MVVSFLAAVGVLSAVQFNREAQLGTIEVENVWTSRMLATKVQAVETTVAQPSPKLPFHLD